MSALLIVIIASVIVVAFFVVGMSLTRIIKGHDIDSEISTNKNMQARGIKCAVQEAREAETEGKEKSDCNTDCASCLTGCTENAAKEPASEKPASEKPALEKSASEKSASEKSASEK